MEDFQLKSSAALESLNCHWWAWGRESSTTEDRLSSAKPSTHKNGLYKVYHECICMNRKLYLPLGFVLFPSQTRHWACRTGRPGTCSTSLQNISGPFSPQVALALMWALVARLRMAGNKPKGNIQKPNQPSQTELRSPFHRQIQRGLKTQELNEGTFHQD